MQILLYCVVIALGVLPMPPIKTMARAATVPARAGLQHRAFDWRPLRGRRAAAAPYAPYAPAPYAAALGAPFGAAALLGPWRKLDVAPVEGGDSATTTPAAASSSAPEETTTEESYDGGDEGGDFGSDILNSLLEVVGTLLSFFSDPPGAIQKMVDQATKLFSGARSLMATVRAQRQAGAGAPIPDGVSGMVEQVKKLVAAAEELAALGPAGARQARLMLVEAQRILETAKGIVETTGRITNAARKVGQTITRPWTG